MFNFLKKTPKVTPTPAVPALEFKGYREQAHCMPCCCRVNPTADAPIITTCPRCGKALTLDPCPKCGFRPGVAQSTAPASPLGTDRSGSKRQCPGCRTVGVQLRLVELSPAAMKTFSHLTVAKIELCQQCRAAAFAADVRANYRDDPIFWGEPRQALDRTRSRALDRPR